MNGTRLSVSVFRKNALPLFVFLAFALGTSLSAADVSPSSRSQSSTPDHGKQLSLKTRQEVFEKVWKDIDDHYYDKTFNGVDWDAVHTRYRPLVDGAKDDREFYAVMSRMTGQK